MELRNKHVVIYGLGKSGVAAAQLCVAQGARVTGFDRSELQRLSAEARALDAELVTGADATLDLTRAELVVVSPGVPDQPELRAALEAGVEVIGELELASRFLRAPLLVVGGTNGKSTATTLLAALLEHAGLRVFAGANLGRPAAEAAAEGFDVVVWEVSSFQLERVSQLHPKVSVLLNISEDHLDRYDDFQAYADAKGNAFIKQTADDCAVVPRGDAACLQQAQRGAARVVTFGAGGDYDVVDSDILERESGQRWSLSQSRLFGRHNFDNAAAAVAAARAFGIGADAVAHGIAAFEPLPHRMARVACVGGVNYYDDSKATNVGAAVTALLGLSEDKAVLIAGGRDKHGSYEPLVEALARRARAVVLVGEAAERIAAAVGDRVAHQRVSDMRAAVRAARELARAGDAVLLSPACSSYDMFSSYSERGDAFAAAVQELIENEERRAP
ncbi:MAG: UDP-N-acetylmuramoyl-L-alanine--D-glutamate ligase [Polyangiaceae bacterium]